MVALIAVSAALLAPAPLGHAAFPGQNGKIAFGDGALFTMNPNGTGKAPLFADTGDELEYVPAWSPAGDRALLARRECGPSLCFGAGLWVVNADGSGLQQVPGAPFESFNPAWAPDGTRLAYARTTTGFGLDIYAIDVDGTGEVQLTSTARDSEPAWSPDGSRIAFISTRDGSATGPGELYVMNADGSDEARVTTSAEGERSPNWSPDGSRIAFERSGVIWSAKPDGTDSAPLTTTAHSLSQPAWAPDGAKIAAAGRVVGDPDKALFVMDADGSDLTPVLEDVFAEGPDWQPLPVPYPRPKGATPVRVSLVPAYAACIAPNRTHGPPLASGSCNPPAPESAELTVGDAPASMSGFVRYETILGDVSTPEDEADLGLRVQITDVRDKDTLADYAGEVQGQASTRMTDRDGGVTSTAIDVRFPLTTPCAPTGDPAVGSTCSLTTTLDTLIPGAVVERERTILQLGQVRVVDGGPDGDVLTEPNTVFLRQGVFVP